MARDKRMHRETLKVTEDETREIPRDRDQSAISTQRAHEIADRAEYPDSPVAQDTDEPGEALTARDRMQDPPSAREQNLAKKRSKP